MKKFAIVISMVLALILCAGALAETVTANRSVNMDESLKDMTLNIGFAKDNIDDDCVYAEVYSEMHYDTAKIAGLKAGDTLETSYGDVAVETVETEDDAVLVNGGVYEGGATLCYDEESGDYYETDYEMPTLIIVGQAQLSYADTVKINVYKMDEDMSPTGEGYDTVEVSANEASAKLAEIADMFYGEVSPAGTTAVIGSEKMVITEVTIDYVP